MDILAPKHSDDSMSEEPAKISVTAQAPINSLKNTGFDPEQSREQEEDSLPRGENSVDFSELVVSKKYNLAIKEKRSVPLLTLKLFSGRP